MSRAFNRFFAAATIILTIIFSRCAHQGSLSGGPKDTDPPVVVESSPPERTTRFTADHIRVTFSEFISLKDPGKEIFISPPMKLKPEFKVQGKSLVVEFKEELKPNTTYTINFGNSIVDFTEGNPYSNFEYVFSTGDVIDSLSIPGRVLNAFDLKPEPDIIAMVYVDNNDTIPLDSLPLSAPPKNASRTSKEGNFRINNLPPGEYKLFALQDYNSNFYYDLPNERIAFIDSLILLKPEEAKGDVEMQEESETDEEQPAEPDTLIDLSEMKTGEEIYTLYLFEELDNTQKLLAKNRISSTRLQYCFKLPADSLQFTLLDSTQDFRDWYIPEFSKERDTIDLWLKPGLPDTIRVWVNAGGHISDTTRFYLTQALRTGKPRKEEVKYASFKPNTRVGAMDPFQDLKLEFDSPLASFDTSRILIKSSEDSLSPSISYCDTIHRRVIIHHGWKEGETYRITIDDSAFLNQNGLFNDSTNFGFKVRSTEDYGILIMNMDIPVGPGQYIIQLLDPKENILKEVITDKPGLIRFEYLMPGKYKLKAIEDTDHNGKWSTGNYSAGILPETVRYYPADISIRANWDLQEDWQLTGN